MSSNTTESKKRPAGTPETVSAEKPEPKRTRSFNPRDEAVAVAKRKAMPSGSSKPEAAGTEGAPQAGVPQTGSESGEGIDEVFNPQNKTVGEESLDVSDDAQLFELALATNLEEAMDLAETPQQKARVFAAIKKREAITPAKVENKIKRLLIELTVALYKDKLYRHYFYCSSMGLLCPHYRG